MGVGMAHVPGASRTLANGGGSCSGMNSPTSSSRQPLLGADKSESLLLELGKPGHWSASSHDPWKVICASFACHAIFVEVHHGPWFISSTNIAWGLTHLILKIFLQGLVRKRYGTKVYDCINSDGSLIKLDTMSYFIKEGFFNLSTMLNLKSLWIALMEKTSKPKHTKID